MKKCDCASLARTPERPFSIGLNNDVETRIIFLGHLNQVGTFQFELFLRASRAGARDFPCRCLEVKRRPFTRPNGDNFNETDIE